MTEHCSHSGETRLDRSPCAESCEAMHTVCVNCGLALNFYFNSPEYAVAKSARRGERYIRVFRIIDSHLPLSDRADQIMAEFGE